MQVKVYKKTLENLRKKHIFDVNRGLQSGKIKKVPAKSKKILIFYENVI